MYRILLTSVAAVLLTGSLANAENEYMNPLQFQIGQGQAVERHAAAITTGTFGASTDAFLLGQDENGSKAGVNTYGPRRSAARIPHGGVSTSTTAGRLSDGLLLGQDANGKKAVVNQYAR